MRLTPGGVTCSRAAAEVMEPVVITARNTSICLIFMYTMLITSALLSIAIHPNCSDNLAITRLPQFIFRRFA